MTAKLTQKQIRQLIDNYIQADAEIKKIEKFKDKVKEQLVALGEGAHRGNVGQVTVSKTETSRLDNALLKAKYGDNLADCYKPSVSVTVRIAKFDEE